MATARVRAVASVIAEHMATDGAYGAPVWSLDYARRVNADGWSVDVEVSADGRQRTRYEGVVLTPAELERAYRLAEKALQLAMDTCHKRDREATR